jgi:hypothetical protein
MSDLEERMLKWIADSGDDTEELQEAAQIMQDAILKLLILENELSQSKADWTNYRQGYEDAIADSKKLNEVANAIG